MGTVVHYAQNQAETPELSARMREVMQMFGVSPHAMNVSGPEIDVPIAPGEIVLVTGPSGCGKTTLFTHLFDVRQVSWLTLEDRQDDHRAVVDCFDLPLCDTLAILARCGLSEAPVLLRRPAELSQGQRYRFELARCLAAPQQIIVADEFCSVLDRTVACILCWQMRKLISQTGKTLVAATAHEDIAQDLEPDHWLQMDLGGEATWQKGGGDVQRDEPHHH